tara:strand:- start:33515 stop:33646 length:132 start_codon:yes stop_codon:yes gene_type:complete
VSGGPTVAAFLHMAIVKNEIDNDLHRQDFQFKTPVKIDNRLHF